jgi:sulfatase maturation enzyme AslB (radical SAM superfamily)
MLLNKIKSLFVSPAPGSLEPAVVNAYNSSRTIRHKKYICHAPFNNMYFNSLGHVANCWLTFDNPEQYDETRTIQDIWQGPKFKKLRAQIKQKDLQTSCKTCQNYLLNGNFTNVLAKAYDNDVPLGDFPTLMEFELENTCNLECTMCNGLLSSSIRKNREGLPPLQSPYGDKFVQELREFIPHLKEARFNGGEPFLIHIYYKIWDAILELNPTLRMVIATNGSALNARIKDYLSRGNFHINLSMDGFSKETYEKVRINGNHDRLMENFDYFHKYCKDNDRVLCVMINPLRQNWQEMPHFVNFCNDRNIQLWFNTIVRPEDQAIWNLSVEELRNIYQTLSSAFIKPCTITSANIYQYNLDTYNNLVHHQIKDWLRDAEKRADEAKAVFADASLSAEQNFWNKMKAYLEKKGIELPEEKLSLLQNKMAELRTELGNDWNSTGVYASLLNADMNIVYSKLLTDSPAELATITRTELLKNRA